jgi:hypothetical protein
MTHQVKRESSFVRFTQPTEDYLHLNFWDAPYAKLSELPTVTKFVIDAKTESDVFGIAYKFFGDPGLYWVILMYNGLADAVHDLRPGTPINIPDQTLLYEMLGSASRNANRVRRDRIIL